MFTVLPIGVNTMPKPPVRVVWPSVDTNTFVGVGEEVKLPSDLSGITTVTYKYDPKDLPAALGPACNRIRDIINELGPNN